MGSEKDREPVMMSEDRDMRLSLDMGMRRCYILDNVNSGQLRTLHGYCSWGMDTQITRISTCLLNSVPFKVTSSSQPPLSVSLPCPI